LVSTKVLELDSSASDIYRDPKILFEHRCKPP